MDAGGSSSVTTLTRFSLAIFRLSPPLPAASHLVCVIYSTTPALRPSPLSTLVSAFPPSSSPSRMHSRTRISVPLRALDEERVLPLPSPSPVPLFITLTFPPLCMPARIKAHMQAYLRDHQRWKQHAAAVIPLASIVPPGSPSELLCLSRLAALLGLSTLEGAAERAEGVSEGSGLEASLSSVGRGRGGGRAVDVRAVSRALAQLPVPTGWAPDPVTKLWPRHKGSAHAGKGGSARGLTREERAELQQFVESLTPPDASAPKE
ncbi:unnamed protein product [Closterium sp. Naga37s-1]|nr:unnamed protein product [Closterium sp. Naga37s-1]